jgi:small neutral amino acid transporter SnatA (MarC family)
MVAVTSARAVELGGLRVAGGLTLAAAAVRPALGNLGLPCPLRTLTGVPCPLCGMTTSVTDAVHLHLGHAVAANPMGVLAVVVAVALLAFRRAERVVVPRALAVVAPVAVVAMWAFELHRFRFV